MFKRKNNKITGILSVLVLALSFGSANAGLISDDSTASAFPDASSIKNKLITQKEASTVVDSGNKVSVVEGSAGSVAQSDIPAPISLSHGFTVRTATKGSTCSASGEIAVDTSGKVLSCQSNRWDEGTTGGASSDTIRTDTIRTVQARSSYIDYYYRVRSKVLVYRAVARCNSNEILISGGYNGHNHLYKNGVRITGNFLQNNAWIVESEGGRGSGVESWLTAYAKCKLIN